jgi:hypothetical protein
MTATVSAILNAKDEPGMLKSLNRVRNRRT